jgi:hypothetical protein
MSCCGRQRTLMRESESTPSTGSPSPVAAATPEVAQAVRLRYIGGASALISGPVTNRTYKFSPLQPTQFVDVRDSIAMLRTRLFVRTF